LVNTGSNVYLDYYDGVADTTTGSNYILAKTWTHVAVTRAGSTVRLFINGVLSGTGTSTANHTTAQTFFIGRYGADLINYFNGYISNLRIVKGTAVYTSTFTIPSTPLTAITNTSLLLLGTNGAIIDQHSSNNLIAPATSPTTNASIYKYGTKSIYFTGGNYLVVKNSTNSLSFAGDFTIEFWLYQVSSIGSTSEFMGTISNYVGAASGWCVDEFSHGLRFSYTGASGSFDWYPNLTITLNTWVHIAIVRSGSTLTGYLNGTAGSSTQTSSITIISNHDLWIGQGYNSNASGACTFYLDDFRITNGIARYTSNFTAPSAAFNIR
jgi:hypothetical protein